MPIVSFLSFILFLSLFSNSVVATRFTMAPKIKLTYFDIEGRGECVRLALALANVPFEDDRIPFSKWPEVKPTLPFGQLPVLTIDDGPMRTQSAAMVKYIGKRFSKTLYPTDDAEKLFAIEEAIGAIQDIEAAWGPALYISMRPERYGYPLGFSNTEEGKAKIRELREAFVKEEMPRHLKRISDMLQSHNGKFLVEGDTPTVADCLAIPFLRGFTRGHIDHVPTTCLDAFPAVVEYIKNFCALEGVKGRYQSGLY
jgi:glutathione S-transferase